MKLIAIFLSLAFAACVPIPSQQTRVISKSPTPTTAVEQAVSTGITLTPRPKDPVAQMILGSQACSLPCWVGLVPGSSSPEENAQFLSEFDLQTSEDEQLEFARSEGSLFRQPYTSFGGNQLWQLAINWDDHKVTRVAALFAEIDPFLHPAFVAGEHGIPRAVGVDVASPDYEGPSQYWIRWHDKSINTTITYYGSFGDAGHRTICLDETENVYVLVQLYSDAFISTDRDAVSLDGWSSSEDVFGLTPAAMIEALSKGGDCLEILPEFRQLMAA
jgi:hypothetical protein